jgi:integrase
MARRPRASRLETRSARLRLPIANKPYDFTALAPGIGLGYRRCKGAGRWVLRIADGKGGYATSVIGYADDYQDADGEHALDFWQAQARGLTLARGEDSTGTARAPASLDQALTDYEAELKAHGASVQNAKRVRHHATPSLLARPVALLNAEALTRWRNGLIEDGVKSATINRTFKAAKAALNNAARLDSRITLTTQKEWREALTKLARDSDEDVRAIPTDDEVRAVIAAAWKLDPGFGLLIEVAAVTGARMSQLARIRVSDLRDDARILMPASRKGHRQRRVASQAVAIPTSLAAKLRKAAGNRPASDPLLLKSDGTLWNPERSEQRAPFATIAAQVGLAGQTMYCLRHASICRQIMNDVPIKLIADYHDTSILMIEASYAATLSLRADAVERTRAALLDPAMPPADNVIPLPRKG